ncbi:hypothetical protein COTS27_01028 [Spirochaetota bacterium]|nr:hypothetical protein COTS27_01028 [Spirochaetota bacterium]
MALLSYRFKKPIPSIQAKMKSSTLQPVMNTLQPLSFFTNFNYFIQYSNIAI